MSLLRRIPFRPDPGSSEPAPVTRSILESKLIHGISKLTMADMADKTPLAITLNSESRQMTSVRT